MDLVNHSDPGLLPTITRYCNLACKIGLQEITYLPSELKGDNIPSLEAQTSWFSGAAFIGVLEAFDTKRIAFVKLPFRFLIDDTTNVTGKASEIIGRTMTGTINPGDRVRIQPSGQENRVIRVSTVTPEIGNNALADQKTLLCLADPTPASRGDLISTIDAPAEIANQFEATIVWISKQPMMRGRTYLAKIGA